MPPCVLVSADPQHTELVAELKQKDSAGWVQSRRGICELVGAFGGKAA